MPVERAAGGTSLVDVLDRVLDKGIVIDAWVRVSLVGIDLITVEARVVVASIDTYLKYSEGGAPTSWASCDSLRKCGNFLSWRGPRKPSAGLPCSVPWRQRKRIQERTAASRREARRG